MKIIYEPNDIVEIDDELDAGIYACCTVKLISKHDNHWLCSFISCIGGGKYPKTSFVDEIYLNPN